ncbi:MAG: ABC transporter permease [Clostridia bacterium]
MDSILTDMLSFGLPLFIIAIGGIFSERSGITNLALEGFMGFGAFFGALVAVLITGKGVQSTEAMYVAIIAAAIGGALFALLHAFLCVIMKADMVISGVVMNILATALTAFLVPTINEKLFHASADGKFRIGIAGRFSIPGLSEIPYLGGLFSNIYTFEIIIVVIAVFCWLVLYKTRFGMRLRACGEFPQAADAAGINVTRIRFSAVMISGALSGIGGMCFAYSLSSQFAAYLFFVGYGYLSIAALIFGNWKILPTFGACMLFAFVKSSANYISSIEGFHITSTVNTTLFAALPYAITLLVLIFFSKKNRAPRALGEIYDKGKR